MDLKLLIGNIDEHNIENVDAALQCISEKEVGKVLLSCLLSHSFHLIVMGL